jgi:hypothetical protein
MGPIGSALLVVAAAVNSPTMVLDGHDFYGRLAMPDILPTAAWCPSLAECAGAIERKHGSVMLRFVDECHINGALRWIREARVLERHFEPLPGFWPWTLFVATDSVSFAKIVAAGNDFSAVLAPHHDTSVPPCSSTKEIARLRGRLVCDLMILDTAISEPDTTPGLNFDWPEVLLLRDETDEPQCVYANSQLGN